MILPEKKSDTILMIQGHFQCQKVKLNILNVTKYGDIMFTYIYRWKKVFLRFILNGKCISVISQQTQIRITSIIRCTSDKQIGSAWSPDHFSASI